ncbi:hypothetical protein A33O_21191 [Nitratireductor aquibiodomus RA22]|uniref:Uncharacterized protein n=1 Tax=Nitratireductor aquibiodomus RA22 TaxID=1189611 RepID=I5BR85_9HYPH|nr:hypothetical protein A33O_21191 [Nitratireductor aquibiodomus RA22]
MGRVFGGGAFRRDRTGSAEAETQVAGHHSYLRLLRWCLKFCEKKKERAAARLTRVPCSACSRRACPEGRPKPGAFEAVLGKAEAGFRSELPENQGLNRFASLRKR